MIFLRTPLQVNELEVDNRKLTAVKRDHFVLIPRCANSNQQNFMQVDGGQHFAMKHEESCRCTTGCPYFMPCRCPCADLEDKYSEYRNFLVQ